MTVDHLGRSEAELRRDNAKLERVLAELAAIDAEAEIARTRQTLAMVRGHRNRRLGITEPDPKERA